MWLGVGVTTAVVSEYSEQDLKQILTDFWLGLLEDNTADPQDKMKASECLAKYVLGEGQRRIKVKTALASTNDLMKMVEDLEKE